MSRRPDQQQFLDALGAQLATLRKKGGVTQAQVAERAGIDAQTVSRIEAGKLATSLLRLRDLAHALGVELPELLPGETSSDADAELEMLAIWRRVPADRQALALRLLRDVARP